MSSSVAVSANLCRYMLSRRWQPAGSVAGVGIACFCLCCSGCLFHWTMRSPVADMLLVVSWLLVCWGEGSTPRRLWILCSLWCLWPAHLGWPGFLFFVMAMVRRRAQVLLCWRPHCNIPWMMGVDITKHLGLHVIMSGNVFEEYSEMFSLLPIPHGQLRSLWCKTILEKCMTWVLWNPSARHMRMQ